MTTALPVLRKYQLFKIATRLKSQDFTGSVQLEDTDGRITVSFVSGTPILASSTKVALSFPAFLLRKRRLDRPKLKTLLEESSQKGLPLEELAVHKGLFSPKDLLRLNRELSIYVFSIAFQKDQIPYRIILDKKNDTPPVIPHELDLHEGVFRSVVVDRDIDFFLRMFRDRWEIPLNKTADFYRYLIQFRSVFYGEDITALLMEPDPTPEHILDMAEDRESAAKQLFALCFTGMLTFKEEAEEGLQSGMVPIDADLEQGRESKTVLLVPDGEDGKPITSFFASEGGPFQAEEIDEAQEGEPEEKPDERDDFQRFLDEGFSFGDPGPDEFAGPDLDAESTEDEVFEEDGVPGRTPTAPPEPATPPPEPATPPPEPATPPPEPATPPPEPATPPPKPATPPTRPIEQAPARHTAEWADEESESDGLDDTIKTQIVDPSNMFSPEPGYSQEASDALVRNDSETARTQMLSWGGDQPAAEAGQGDEPPPVPVTVGTDYSTDMDSLLKKAVEEAEKAVQAGAMVPPSAGYVVEDDSDDDHQTPLPAQEQSTPQPEETREPEEPAALREPVPLPERPSLPERGTDENIERILEDVYRSMLARNLYEILGVTPYSPLSTVRDATYRLKAKYAPAQYVGYMLSSRAKTILQYVQNEIERACLVLGDARQRALYDNRMNTDYGQDRRVALSFLFDAEGYYQDGHKEMEEERWTEALMLFTKAAETNPRDPEYLAFKGWATYQALRSGQSSDSFAPNKARNILERALAVDPRYVRAMLFLARIEREMNNLEAALSWYERLHRLDPSNEEVAAALDWLKMSPRRSTNDGVWGKFKGMFSKK